MNQNSSYPLVIDLDGTLTPTDSLVESVLVLLKCNPWVIFKLVWWLTLGPAKFKSHVAELVSLPVSLMPWRLDFIQWIRDERSKGRLVILATAAHESIANAVSAELALFDHVIATADGHNLKGEKKLEAIQALVGDKFVYAGDSGADLPIWRAAQSAVLVGASKRLSSKVHNDFHVEREFKSVQATWRVWLKGLRAHQWMKNFLLFVPLLTSFTLGDVDRWVAVVLAFIAFSLAASGTYLLNDLWDLESDRQHVRKKFRPLASGVIPIGYGVLGAGALLLAGFAVASQTSLAFLAMLLGYVVLTTIYSWVLKNHVLMDVVMLALLYTYRVLAGAVAIHVGVSPSLLGFSVFVFLSLALVKRCSELMVLSSEGKTKARGRDYRVSDLEVLRPLGIGASLCSVVVFGLYIGAPDTQTRYATPELLWLVAIGLIYWLARIWVKTSRGEMHDDPVIYAVSNRGSRAMIFVMLVTILVGHFFEFSF